MENYIYIYFQTLPKDCTLWDIEDDLDDILQDMGGVTGSGIGIAGGNIDIEFETGPDPLPQIISYLISCGFEGETVLDINGNRKKLSDYQK